MKSDKGSPAVAFADVAKHRNLAPDLQQTLLELEPTTDAKSSPREKDVRQIAIEPNWIKQRKAWKRMLSLREREQAQQQRNRANASRQATLD